MSKQNKTGHKATTAAKSATSTATNNGIRRDTALGDIGKRKSSAEVVGRILERDAKRHEVGKYAGVRVAVIMPDGSMTTALLSDYGFEQLFLDICGAGDTPADHVREAIEAYEDAPIGRSTRTLAAAYYRKHERPASCVEFDDDGNAVTIRVTGKAYENLTKLAAAQNSVGWCGNDNTAATTLDFWVGSFLWRTQYAPGSVDGCDITDVMNDIQDGIDTGHPDGTPEDAARKRELSAAFDAVKF